MSSKSRHLRALLELIAQVQEYEECHGHVADDWTCFLEHLDALDPELVAQAQLWRETRKGLELP